MYEYYVGRWKMFTFAACRAGEEYWGIRGN
jgi:hypothetical protein